MWSIRMFEIIVENCARVLPQQLFTLTVIVEFHLSNQTRQFIRTVLVILARHKGVVLSVVHPE